VEPLQDAVLEDAIDQAKQLLDQGANVNAPDSVVVKRKRTLS
jgi:hypothetical protein